MKRRPQKPSGQIVGFIVTPGEIAGRIAGMDAAIQALARDVKAVPVNTPALGVDWRSEFDAFTRRWSVQRDAFSEWDARLFATRVMPILDDYENSYRYWAKDFQKKSGRAPTVPKALPVKGAESLIPTELWILIGVAVVLFILVNSTSGTAYALNRR